MNRAERRKNGIKVPAPKMKHLPEKQYKEEIDRAYRRGFDQAFDTALELGVAYMFSVPLLVLHENFQEVMRKEWEGKSRIEHFYELCEKVYAEYNNYGDHTITRLTQDVFEKTGFDVGGRLYRKKGDENGE